MYMVYTYRETGWRSKLTDPAVLHCSFRLVLSMLCKLLSLNASASNSCWHLPSGLSGRACSWVNLEGETKLYGYVRCVVLRRFVKVLRYLVDLHLHHIQLRDKHANRGLHHRRALSAYQNFGQGPRGDHGVQGRAHVR